MIPVNRRVVTGKDRSILEWFEPIRERFDRKLAPVVRSIELNPLIAPFARSLRVSKTSTFMVVPIQDSDTIRICAFLIDSLKGDPPVIVTATLDTTDVKLSWRLATLFESVFNGIPLEADHQTELESLLFSV